MNYKILFKQNHKTNRVVRPEPVYQAGIQFPRQYTLATSSVEEKVQGEVLDEVVDVVLQAPAVEGLEYS